MWLNDGDIVLIADSGGVRSATSLDLSPSLPPSVSRFDFFLRLRLGDIRSVSLHFPLSSAPPRFSVSSVSTLARLLHSLVPHVGSLSPLHEACSADRGLRNAPGELLTHEGHWCAFLTWSDTGNAPCAQRCVRGGRHGTGAVGATGCARQPRYRLSLRGRTGCCRLSGSGLSIINNMFPCTRLLVRKWGALSARVDGRCSPEPRTLLEDRHSQVPA